MSVGYLTAAVLNIKTDFNVTSHGVYVKTCSLWTASGIYCVRGGDESLILTHKERIMDTRKMIRRQMDDATRS